MTPSARLSAAIEVIAEIEARRRPAAEALKDWGLSHRFAGSGDRAAIGGLVYDALRRRASAAWIMGDASPRAVLLGALRLARGIEPDRIADLCTGERFAPRPLTEAERAALAGGSLDDAPDHVRGDYPEWLDPKLGETFGPRRAEEAAALATRAPLDLRVNTLKVDRARAGAAIDHLAPTPTPLSPDGLRILHAWDARPPAVQAETAFVKGWVEVQDEGSQLAALLAGARPGMQVIDLCAGAGGKTLALAAMMDNRGQILATDSDTRRLAPIHDRLARAGTRNVQVRAPRGRGDDPLQGEGAKADLVLVDAPCTGSGTWRRNPDAKWRLRPNAFADRQRDQAAVLDRAAALVKPGGRIAYVTCSVLPEENGGAVAAFTVRQPGFEALDPIEVAGEAGLAVLAEHAAPGGLLLTPRRTGTDGFFVAVLRRLA